MVLTNLAQTAMTATDVLVMGRLGADALAAGALGSNLYFAPMIFGLGLMLATSPMLATELGRRRHSVRDLRRTVRQGLWVAVCAALPIWLILWNTEPILLAMGQQPELAALAGTYVRALQWGLLPFYAYIVLRSFISALERPRWALVVAFGAVVFNALANWVLVFGNLGFPAFGIAGSGAATALANTLMFVGLAVVVVTDRRFRRYRLFGRFWRADWPRFRALVRLGLPIAGILAFEVTVFNAAAFLMGLIDATALAAHAIALQIASISFMVPMGLSQAATVRVGIAFGAGDADAIRRAGWAAYMLGVAFMAMTALIMITWPTALIGVFIDATDAANAPVVRSPSPSSPSRPCSRSPTARRRRQRQAARPPRHHDADGLCRDRLLGHRHAARRAARLPLRLRRRRHLDGPVGRPCRGGAAASGAMAQARPHPRARRAQGRLRGSLTGPFIGAGVH
jgi:MATE family multidrug resistance protein